MHRANTLLKDEDRRKVEKEKVRAALRLCGYLEWALKEGEMKGKKKEKKKAEDQGENTKTRGFVVLPYMKG